MPIQPIDLQVLFAHLNQVGKDQAVQKDAAVLQQAAHASEIIKKTEQQEHSIKETQATEDGPEKIHDEEEKKKQQTGSGKQEEQREDEDEQDILRDPDLGHHIDISG